MADKVIDIDIDNTRDTNTQNDYNLRDTNTQNNDACCNCCCVLCAIFFCLK
jgi:hypothetical protein